MGFQAPDGCFVHTTADRTVVVRESDGEATHAVVDDKLVPVAEWKAGMVKAGATVTNPDGFTGHPAHDRDDPSHRVESHGFDPATHFMHLDAAHPTVVRKDTGDKVGHVKNGVFEAV